MIRTFGMVFFVSLLVLVSAVPDPARAGECAYGSFMRGSGHQTHDWENATAHPMSEAW